MGCEKTTNDAIKFLFTSGGEEMTFKGLFLFLALAVILFSGAESIKSAILKEGIMKIISL